VGTRHNVGAATVELLAARHSAALRRERQRHARAGEARVGDKRLALGVPETYMNDSGLATRALLHRYCNDELPRLLVVHDELDLEPGVVRVKSGGGTAGHNGLRSIEAHLHSLEFVRIRIGIGKPPGREEGASHVLSRPSRREREALEVAVELAADAVELCLADGVAGAMNVVNAR
jgi:peptidyl-tRNA hydrolase, PTH1 family